VFQLRNCSVMSAGRMVFEAVKARDCHGIAIELGAHGQALSERITGLLDFSWELELFQGGMGDFAAKLRLAALLFINTIEERTRIQPDSQAMQIRRREFHVVMTG